MLMHSIRIHCIEEEHLILVYLKIVFATVSTMQRDAVDNKQNILLFHKNLSIFNSYAFHRVATNANYCMDILLRTNRREIYVSYRANIFCCIILRKVVFRQ